jgi:hypothetical protein
MEKYKLHEAETAGDCGGSGENIASGQTSGAVVMGTDKADKKKKIFKRKMSFSEWVESEKDKKK